MLPVYSPLAFLSGLCDRELLYKEIKIVLGFLSGLCDRELVDAVAHLELYFLSGLCDREQKPRC